MYEPDLQRIEEWQWIWKIGFRVALVHGSWQNKVRVCSWSTSKLNLLWYVWYTAKLKIETTSWSARKLKKPSKMNSSYKSLEAIFQWATSPHMFWIIAKRNNCQLPWWPSNCITSCSICNSLYVDQAVDVFLAWRLAHTLCHLVTRVASFSLYRETMALFGLAMKKGVVCDKSTGESCRKDEKERGRERERATANQDSQVLLILRG